MRRDVRCDFCRVDWPFSPKWDLYFGMMFNHMHAGLGFGFFQHSNIDPTVGVRLIHFTTRSKHRSPCCQIISKVGSAVCAVLLIRFNLSRSKE